MTNPDQYAPTVWGNKNEEGRDLTLPSGQKCRVRKIGMEDILELDLIDLMDTFTKQLTAEPSDKKTEEDATGDAFMEMLKDPDRRHKIITAINSVVPRAVIAPSVEPLPEKSYKKAPGLIYVDDISLEDRFAIFGASFDGWGDVSKFRAEQTEGVGAVAESESVPSNS